MTIAYFDCFAGAGGDMIVASLLNAGADFNSLKTELAKLKLVNVKLTAETVLRRGLSGTLFTVAPLEHEHAHRHLDDILSLINAAALPQRVKDRSSRIFTRLAEAEAAVHGISVQEVHFHEVGAVDSIMDVVGGCIAMELLDIDRVYCSAIPVGSGTITCRHGMMPAPAPATAKLLVGAKTVQSDADGEVTTPTAAAVLTTLAESFGPIPEMDVTAVGYGAGSKNNGPLPNLLRVYIGQSAGEGDVDTVIELSANIDDCSGEILGATIEKLFAAGCLDAWATPIVAKKSRPGWMLSAICDAADTAAIEKIIFSETTTFGIRRRQCNRAKLRREHKTVETAYGPIRVKIGRLGAKTMTAQPEYADCATAAETHHVPVKEVFSAAEAAYRAESNA